MIDGFLVGFWVEFYLSKYVFFTDEMYNRKESDFTKIVTLINFYNAL